MALDRVWELRRLGLTDRAPLSVWLEPVDGSPIIASVDAERGRPVETAVLRMRWRDDVGLSSVFVSPDGDIWIPSETREVGRRRMLDVAVTHYEDAAITVTGTPPTTAEYTPQAGYTLAKDGAAVQNLEVTFISVLLTHQALFRCTNPGAAGAVPATLQARIGAAGPIGTLTSGYGSRLFFQQDESVMNVTADDPTIPVTPAGADNPRRFSLVADDGGVGAALAVGGYIRILSTEEVPSD